MTNPEKQADHVEALWSEALRMWTACAEGDCLYTDRGCHTYPEGRPATRRCGHDHVCLGYEGRKHIEHGVPLMRYRICRRYQAWAKQEQQRIRAQKSKPADKAPPPQEWK